MIDLQFGKVTTHTPQEDGSTVIQTTTKHDGRLKQIVTEIEVPKLIKNQGDAMAVLMDALELISNAKSHHIHIELVADPFTFQYKRVVLRYTKKP
jgi:hypothetical protein